jgi:hypothetical protein
MNTVLCFVSSNRFLVSNSLHRYFPTVSTNKLPVPCPLRSWSIRITFNNPKPVIVLTSKQLHVMPLDAKALTLALALTKNCGGLSQARL